MIDTTHSYLGKQSSGTVYLSMSHRILDMGRHPKHTTLMRKKVITPWSILFYNSAPRKVGTRPVAPVGSDEKQLLPRAMRLVRKCYFYQSPYPIPRTRGACEPRPGSLDRSAEIAKSRRSHRQSLSRCMTGTSQHMSSCNSE